LPGVQVGDVLRQGHHGSRAAGGVQHAVEPIRGYVSRRESPPAAPARRAPTTSARIPRSAGLPTNKTSMRSRLA